MNLREIGWEGVDRTDVAECRDECRAFVNMVISRQFLSNAGNFLISA
jgi:hypothetical protein